MKQTHITLYHNCILTPQYTEVFRTKALLKSYLETLDTAFSGVLEIDNVYTTLNGTITIDTDVINYETDFNYIRFQEYIVEEGENPMLAEEVYAFVDSFRIINGLLVINYTTDIWSTYAGRWSLRESLVTNSYRTIAGEPFEKPLPYIYNPSQITVRSLETYANPDTDDRFDIVMKIQLYKLISGGNIEYSKFKYEGYVVYQGKLTSSGYNKLLNINTINDELDDIVFEQQRGYWRMHNEGTIDPDEYYCNITDLFVIPKSWNINNYVVTDADNNKITMPANSMIFYRLTPIVASTEIKYYSVTAEDGYNGGATIISYGIWSNQLKYDYDGINKHLQIHMCLDKDELHFYLRVNGVLTEITNQFKMLQDYEPVSPDVLAQREIARKQATIQGIVATVEGASQVALNVASAIATGGASETISEGANMLMKFNQKSLASRLSATNPATTQKGISQAGGVVGGIGKMVNGISSIVFANKAKYLGFQPTNNETDAITNAYYGICTCVITYSATLMKNKIPNYEESNKAVREVGYNVDYITSNLDIISSSITTHNVVKFAFVRIVGLSGEICDIIADILTNGVKIWYTHLIT